MRKEILRVSHLYKQIGRKDVLIDFSLNLYEGEILGIMGLKGSGKSLLFHILSGEEEFDKGTLFFNENKINGRRLLLKNQIAIVGKGSLLQANMSVMDNIFHLRKHYHHQVWIHEKKLRERTREELVNIGMDISPDALICQLTRIEGYMIEILKRYIMGAKVIILDDFSEKYSVEEILQLNQLLDRLKSRGVSFIVAGYQLQNLQMCAERILFLINGSTGKIIPNIKRNQINENMLFQIFPSELPPRERNTPEKKELLFRAENVHTENLNDITFDLYKGEILTVVDFEGVNNQSLFNCLMNPELILDGELIYKKRFLTRRDNALKNNEILFVDFNLENKIIEQMSLQDNLCMGVFHKVSTMGFFSNKSMEFIKKDFLQWYPSEILGKCKNCMHLSEKDKMAIMLYRIRLKKPQILLCIDPRRYTDALTYEMMKEQLWNFAGNGTAILILAQSVEQNYMLTDRFLFWDKGRLKEFTLEEFDRR